MRKPLESRSPAVSERPGSGAISQYDGDAEREGWSKRTLRSLCLTTEGVNPTRSPDGAFEYIDVSAVSNTNWRITNSRKHTGVTAPSRARKLVRAGDIIFATVRPTLKRVALVPPARDGQIVSTAFCVCRVDPAVADRQFVYYALLRDDAVAALGRIERGANYPAVTDADVLGLEIPFPPLAEQRAIARVLAAIQAGVDVQDRLMTALRSLKAATMAVLLREGCRGETPAETAVGSIPPSWAVARVADHFVVGNGSTPSRKNSAYWLGGKLPWLTSTRVHDRIIAGATEYVTDVAAHECHLPLVPRGSLVIAITGQGKTLGNAAKVTFDTFINQHLAYLAPRNASVNTDFMLAYLETRYGDFRRVASSGGSTKGALTCRFLAEYLFPLPPRSEQDQIAEVWAVLTRRLRVAEHKRRESATLFDFLLERLTSGELRVADVAER